MFNDGLFFFDGSPRSPEAQAGDLNLIHVTKFIFFRLRVTYNGIPKGSIFLYEYSTGDPHSEVPLIRGVNALYPQGVDIPKSIVSFAFDSGRVGSSVPFVAVSVGHYLPKPLSLDLWVLVFADRAVLEDDTLVCYYDFYDDTGLLLDTLVLPID